MLLLIGLGLCPEDLTLRAFEALRSADEVYAETYTNTIGDEVTTLERRLSRPIIPLQRKNLEDNSSEFLQKAQNKKVALLVSGDPLAATTHISLLQEARTMKLEVQIFHAPSILTAVAETGLQLYKFGRTVTLGKLLQPSVADFIRQNLQSDLHTLVLLDIGLTIKEALPNLAPLVGTKKIVAAARLGTPTPSIAYGTATDLVDRNFGKPPHCLIIPAKLHFTEAEFLEGLNWKN